MESTEKRIPEWALKAVDDARRAGFAAHGYAWDGWPSDSAEAIARLLVTVREKALREARMVDGLSHTAHAAICALIDKEPS